jgi:hypothetical protein
MIQVTVPTNKRQRTIRSIASVSTSTMQSSKNGSQTVERVRQIMNKLNLEDVTNHFNAADGEGKGQEGEEEIESYVVCGGVSVEVYNEFADDGERLRIPLRCLDLDDDGRLLIVEYPMSTVHEATVRNFEYEFLRAWGDGRELGQRGSMDAHRPRARAKQADATFGPLKDTRNATNPPHPRTVDDWITLAVEVGRSQTWDRLEEAARWWLDYVGIQYILLLKVSPRGQSMKYRCYDLTQTPMRVSEERFSQSQNAEPINITFDNRRILSIPAGQALPNGVNDVSVVNLRAVMHGVIRSLS